MAASRGEFTNSESRGGVWELRVRPAERPIRSWAVDPWGVSYRYRISPPRLSLPLTAYQNPSPKNYTSGQKAWLKW